MRSFTGGLGASWLVDPESLAIAGQRSPEEGGTT